MIHYITCHFGTDELIDIQLQHISRFTDTDYKVWMSYTTPASDEIGQIRNGEVLFKQLENEIDSHEAKVLQHKNKVHRFEYIPILLAQDASCLPIRDFSWGNYVASQNHQNNLSIMTERVLKSPDLQDTDMLVWIDSDTFLVDKVDELLASGANTFSAVKRLTIQDASTPHPCFAYCSVAFYKEHYPNINWLGSLRGYYGLDDRVFQIHGDDQSQRKAHTPLMTRKAREEQEHLYHDTGSALYHYFTDIDINWIKLNKSGNLGNVDQVFEIYDNKILHVGMLQQSLLKSISFLEQDNSIKIYDDILAGKYLKGI